MPHLRGKQRTKRVQGFGRGLSQITRDRLQDAGVFLHDRGDDQAKAAVELTSRDTGLIP